MSTHHSPSPPAVGLFGAGAMGRGMLASLQRAGYAVSVWDPAPAAQQRIREAGARLAGSAATLAAEVPCMVLSLPSSSIFRQTAETVILPRATAGSLVIDTTTLRPADACWAHQSLTAAGLRFIEAPVTGGPAGAAKGELRLFVGARAEDFQAAQAVLRALGEPFLCGGPGSGQIVKGVNQLAMGLRMAACLESVFYGLHAGLSPEIIAGAVGGSEGWRQEITRVCQAVQDGKVEGLGIKYNQYAMFIEAASQAGTHLPICEALLAFCEGFPEIITEANRMSPSFWRALHGDRSSGT